MHNSYGTCIRHSQEQVEKILLALGMKLTRPWPLIEVLLTGISCWKEEMHSILKYGHWQLDNAPRDGQHKFGPTGLIKKERI